MNFTDYRSIDLLISYITKYIMTNSFDFLNDLEKNLLQL